MKTMFGGLLGRLLGQNRPEDDGLIRARVSRGMTLCPGCAMRYRMRADETREIACVRCGLILQGAYTSEEIAAAKERGDMHRTLEEMVDREVPLVEWMLPIDAPRDGESQKEMTARCEGVARARTQLAKERCIAAVRKKIEHGEDGNPYAAFAAQARENGMPLPGLLGDFFQEADE